MIFSEIGLRIATFIFLFLFFLVNLLITRRVIRLEKVFIEYDNQDVIPIREFFLQKILTPKTLMLAYLAVSFFFALVLSGITSGHWLTVQSFLNSSSFNFVDPVFSKDIKFFIFSIPFYRLVYAVLVSAVVGSALLVGLTYFLFTPKNQFRVKLSSFKQPQIHFSILISIFFLLKAWSYKLSAYELLYSERGIIYGAGYTDVTAQLPAYNILAIIALALAVLIIISIFLRIYRIIIGSVALLIIASILLGSVYPSAIQKFRVEPNQFVRETPFIENAIAFTRKAYNLHDITIKQFPVDRNLTLEDLENNSNTINNIRLWDYRPLRQTFSQLQTLRLYYDFKDVDIDRYWIDGEYRQVMLSARELDQRQLQAQAQTWVNQRLRYTHGYGIVMSAVNETTPEGLPSLLVKDIPPKTSSPDLEIKEPGIYFGELTTNYVIVNSNTKEFHYPSGNDNVETTYQGNGGVPLNSILKRVFFALFHADYRLLLTGELTADSKILYNRDITTIAQKITPFLHLDKDPYIVLFEGRLYWIRDAYTVSSMFPYSQPFGNNFNYIRNSIKIVTDAYHGTTKFYISDNTDPIIQTYSNIFPDLFEPLEQMPDGLRRHIRYPSYYFNIQARMLTLYHMQNPQVFYNREDAWSIPQEIFQGESQIMEPYYMIMQLPGEKEPEYILMLPFTPLNRLNMVAWLAGRSDGDNYGKLVLYQFPKEAHIFGPMQIESRIDQNSEISQQFSLWDQRGSQVLRGNLLVIPIENSLLYVEPIFLQAEQSKFPELRRVIVAFGERIVMEETLEASLAVLFGSKKPADVKEPESPPIEQGEDTGVFDQQQLISLANRLFKEAVEYQRRGDWAEYGNALKELEDVLNKLANITEMGISAKE